MSEQALRVAGMAAWIEDEQRTLWDDLRLAIDSATNKHWSISASNIARRIVAAARFVGPTERGSIPYGLEAGGVYDAVYSAGGISVREPDEAEWDRWDNMMAKYGTTRATMTPRYAATVVAIRDPRENDWISGSDD